MNVTFEINVENDAHHTLGSTQSNRSLFIHCQMFCLSQCLVVCWAYFHHAFFVFHNVWLFVWPTSTMHSMNIDFNRLLCSQRLIVFFIIIKICLHLHQQLGMPLLNHSQNHKLTMRRKREVRSTPLFNHSQNHKLTIHRKREVRSTPLLNHSQKSQAHNTLEKEK